MIDLVGKRAIVTGAGRGIGRAIAGRLAGLGAAVAVTDIDAKATEDAAAEISRDGGKAMALPLDVTSLAAVVEAERRIREAWGGTDILINNAGWDKVESFLKSTPETWDRVVEINLMGVVRTCYIFLPGMIERHSGAIVNIGSDAGRVGSSGEAVYSAAKGGVITFTKTLARENAAHGVRVNCVCPGPTDTPLMREQVETQPKLIAALERAIPMGRLGAPADLAAAVAFLASDQASFITGQTLSVSGGLTMV